MRRFILTSLLTYLVFALDSSLAPLMQIAGCRPHVAVAGLVFLSARVSGAAGIFTAAVWGLLADCLADRTLGVDLALFTLSALGLESIRQRGDVPSPVLAGVATFVIALAERAASGGLALLDGSPAADATAVCRYAVGSAAYTASVAIAVALIARLIIERQPGATSRLPRVANNGGC